MNGVKLAIPSHSEPLRRKKIGKVANWVKLVIPASVNSEPLLVGKDWKSCKLGEIGHSKSF